MKTGSGQTGSQTGGSTMMTPSALAASGDAINDTRKANTIRGRIGIRRMAVSSPGQATLAAACVGDAARLLQVPVQLGKFRRTWSHCALCHRLLQQGDSVTDLLNDGIQLVFLRLYGFSQRADD